MKKFFRGEESIEIRSLCFLGIVEYRCCLMTSISYSLFSILFERVGGARVLEDLKSVMLYPWVTSLYKVGGGHSMLNLREFR